MAGPPSTYNSKPSSPSSGPSFTRGQDPTQDSLGINDQELILAQSFGLNPTEAASEYTQSHGTYQGGGSRFASGWWSGAQRNITPPPDKKRRVVDAYKDLSEMSPDDLVALQHRLYDAGFYADPYYASGRSGKRPEWGSLDDGTVNAFGESMQRSLRSNGRLTPDEIINDAIGKGGAKGKQDQAQPQRPPLTIQLSNPDDVLAVADATARKVLGRKLTDEELRHYVDTFHSMEANAQQSKYQAEYGGAYDEASGRYMGSGGTITAPPDLSSFIASRERQDHPQEAKNIESMDYAKAFHDLLAGNV